MNLTLDPKLECVKKNHHTWSSTCGGYWCMQCHIAVTDQTVMNMRADGKLWTLDELLEEAAVQSTQWVSELHYWKS